MRATYFRAALRAVAAIGVVVLTMLWPGLNLADAHAYWAAPLNDLYSSALAGGADAYLYAPAFAQALSPLKALPWPVFAGLWLLLMAVCLVVVAGEWAPAIALIPPVLIELHAGNIHLPLAVAIGLGLRYPTTWAFVLLTKPTLGVGLMWFVVRREWRQLAIALGTTLAVVAVSFVIAPAAWSEWFNALIANAGRPISPDYSGVIHVPLFLRLPIALALVAWGARTDRRWTVAVATTLTLPILWINGLAVLVAIPMLIGPQGVVASANAALESGRRRWNLWSASNRKELVVGEEADALRE
jgi:hypothetical protein